MDWFLQPTGAEPGGKKFIIPTVGSDRDIYKAQFFLSLETKAAKLAGNFREICCQTKADKSLSQVPLLIARNWDVDVGII